MSTMSTSSSLNQTCLSYPGWQDDKAAAEKIFVEHSLYDALMREKIRAMRTKQTLHEVGRSQVPPLRKLDSELFSYEGWESDKKDAEKRLVGDCSVLQLGSYDVVFDKMKKKQSLTSDRSSIPCLRDLDEAKARFTYPEWQQDVSTAEQLFVEYVSPSRFYEKLDAMKNKQRLYQNDRSHPEIVALANYNFTYDTWEADRQEFLDRHTGDCTLFQLGITCSFLLQKMEKKQQLHEDRASIAVLKSLDSFQFTYPDWQTDKKAAEGYYTDFSSFDRFQDKVVAMRNKQRLFEGDRSHPDIVALDSLLFSYHGWQADKETVLKRHTGDCTVLQLGSFHAAFQKMKKKQKLYEVQKSQALALDSLLPDIMASISSIHRISAQGDSHCSSAPEKKCVVCLDHIPTHALIPCGHLILCGGCAPNFDKPEGPPAACPLCRKNAMAVTRIFA
jgi:hypothetical protein